MIADTKFCILGQSAKISNISTRKNSHLKVIIQCIKYFVIFNFVVLSDYENISTTKISGFTAYVRHPSQKLESNLP